MSVKAGRILVVVLFVLANAIVFVPLAVSEKREFAQNEVERCVPEGRFVSCNIVEKRLVWETEE